MEVPHDSYVQPSQPSPSRVQDSPGNQVPTEVMERTLAPLPESGISVSEVAPLRIATDSDLLAAETMVAIHRSQPTNPSETVPEPPEASRNTADDENDDDSDDGSSDDDEPNTWLNIQEDTSVPSEEEMKEIEDGPAEISALDRKRCVVRFELKFG